jgi:hypothetical protein
VRWQLEQAEEFRQEVEQYTDAERVVLADAYQALLRYGPLPRPGHHLRFWAWPALTDIHHQGCCPGEDVDHGTQATSGALVVHA